jgi:hypothetical protein
VKKEESDEKMFEKNKNEGILLPYLKHTHPSDEFNRKILLNPQ